MKYSILNELEYDEITILNNTSFQQALKELIGIGDESYLISGWLTAAGLQYLYSDLNKILQKKRKYVYLLVGRPFETEDYNTAIKLAEQYAGYFNFNTGQNIDGLFHAKVYCSYDNDDLFMIWGSTNITGAGMIENLEFNTVIKKKVKESGDIIDSLKSMWSRSEPFNKRILKKVSKTIKEDIMGKEAEKIIQAFNDYKVKEWDYAEIVEEVTQYRADIINALKEVDKTKEYSEFRKEYLFKNIWAITESEGWTQLKDYIIEADAKEIVKHIKNMLDAASREGADPDEIINTGRIPFVLGEAIVTEILHKAMPGDYPILNRRSAFGFLMFYGIDYRGTNTPFKAAPYKTFIKVIDNAIIMLKEYMGKKNNLIQPLIQYRVIDRLCQAMYEDKKYRDIVIMWNTQNREI